MTRKYSIDLERVLQISNNISEDIDEGASREELRECISIVMDEFCRALEDYQMVLSDTRMTMMDAWTKSHKMEMDLKERREGARKEHGKT